MVGRVALVGCERWLRSGSFEEEGFWGAKRRKAKMECAISAWRTYIGLGGVLLVVQADAYDQGGIFDGAQ